MMDRFKMNSKLYMCSCSNFLINFNDLIKHLRISKVHKIRLSTIGIQNNHLKVIYDNDYNEIKPIQLLHNKNMTYLKFNILNRCSKSIISLNKNREKIISNLIPYK